MPATNYPNGLTVEGTDLGTLAAALADQLAEIENLEGLSAAEVAFIDGAVAGTPATGKALILSAAQATAVSALMLECASATIGAPSAEAADARTVSVQLKDRLGGDLAHRCQVLVYVATDAGGDAPGDGALTAALTAGTDGALISSDESGTWFVSESDGDLDVVVTDAADAAASVWVHVVLPNGQRIASAEIAFADDTP